MAPHKTTAPKKATPSKTATGAKTVTPPQVVSDEIALLFKNVASPENQVYFDPSTSPQRATQTDIATSTNTFELSSGPSDVDSYHDYFRLKIAFQDVWKELLDSTVQATGEILYAQYNALKDATATDIDPSAKTFPAPPTNVLTGVDDLNEFIAFLKQAFGIGGGSSSVVVNSSLLNLAQSLGNTLTLCQDWFQQLNDNVANNTIIHEDIHNDDYLQPDKPDTALSGSSRNDYMNGIIGNVQSIIATLNASPGMENDASYQNIIDLLTKLDGMLKEKYAFDVFAPDSVNYGLLLNYRQRWHPITYQVGNLVNTIPLAPQEIRKYTSKTVIKKSRSTKEIEDSLRSQKDEQSDTARQDSEIVSKARSQTNFQANASGSFGNDALYKVSAGMQQGQDQSVESAQTKRDFHEAVFKSAQEYRNNHRMEVSTEESREDETTSYREIRNPNDELTVTYLFYELQRRYQVTESLYNATPVILVANDVPAPQDVDHAWLLRHDWIIKRTILDDSFTPALDYLSANYTGTEIALQTLGMEVTHQRIVVDQISQQISVANAALNSASVKLQSTEDTEVGDLKAQEQMALVKSIFDPLGISRGGQGDGNSDRAAVDFAKDTLNRAQEKVDQLLAQMKTETTALQAAIDKYIKASTAHYNMLADIDRLRIHVKDNILYYMQAIWTYEPPDQRYFRIYNIDVPTFDHHTTVSAAEDGSAPSLIKKFATKVPLYSFAISKFPNPSLAVNGTLKLHQVADIDNLLGFKGNYMIFPMVNFNYMNWFMVKDYINFDAVNNQVFARDPDPDAGLTVAELQTALQQIYAQNPQSFEDNQDEFTEVMIRLISQGEDEIIVPSNSLFIEALPGSHPLLEDFKLIHRAVDVKKAQAEARHMELENLRLASRLVNGQNEDPDIEKKIVIEGKADVNAETD